MSPGKADRRLSRAWNERNPSYDFIVIGSGYGGSIAAARLVNSPTRPSVCILERGKEWPIGTFPDKIEDALPEFRSSLNPLGLYEILNYRDISVVKGCGLGGTSLINANVAIVPDQQIFERTEWPRTLKYDSLLPYYVRAREVLAARPHPSARKLAKVQALDKRARQIGLRADPLNIAVNFSIDGPNAHGMHQTPCIDCGDCVSGCNTGAKNTLYMNYLPMAANGGAHIFTQTNVEWIEKLDGGGWRVHGKYVRRAFAEEKFTLDAKNVILSAGSVNSTEILLRSEARGLKVSPALGTRFSANGNFFGLAYNSDNALNVLGYGTRRTPGNGEVPSPGPTIVSAIRYANLPSASRFAIEDLAFPSAVVAASQTFFTALIGQDTDAGDEAAERERVLRDFFGRNRYQPDGALNHTMMYLVTGPDNARGTMVFETPWFEPDGRMRIEWDNAGRQVLFTRINEELRRHARTLGGTFVSNPLWNVLDMRHLMTVHPLGGCPMGEDHFHGATDEFGRVFAQDGGVHEGLFVADGAILPSATGVNPFLTISALAERIAERKIGEMQGQAYPAAPVSMSMATFDPVEMTSASESELERIFRRTATLGIDGLVNHGGPPVIDLAGGRIRNDEYWKGYFPRGHILNAMSSAIFTGFKKAFIKEGDHYTGLTSDTDGRIRARNSLEEIYLSKPEGTLEAGRYILLRYLDAPWRGYYDVFKLINENFLIGRVYLGEFPRGIRQFTFAMTRTHGFDRMTADEHRALYASGSVPTAEELHGVWRMDVISNNNQLGAAAHLAFDLKPDGRLESRYQAFGLFEGLVLPSFTQRHFQLDDFTPFHDEIRRIDEDLMVGKWIAPVPPGMGPLLSQSLGVFHPDPGGQFGFYYLLSRTTDTRLRTNPLLRPFLDVQLPDGLGMKFDEEMVGWFVEGGQTPSVTRPDTATDCRFNVTMNVRDLNEFIDGAEHEASLSGTISFDRLAGHGPFTVPVDSGASRFHYLRANPETREAEMVYHIEFQTADGTAYTLDGRKFMNKNQAGGLRGVREVLDDYTTLFCRVLLRTAGAPDQQVGTALLKFRTFEDIAAVGNLAGFLRSFRVTGTDNPILQAQGQLRFLAFTGQFVQSEYDPLALPIADQQSGVALALTRLQRLLALLNPALPDRSTFAQLSDRLTQLRAELFADDKLTPSELETIRKELHTIAADYDAAAALQGSAPRAGLPQSADAFRSYAEAAEIHFGYLAGPESAQFRGGLLREFREATEPATFAPRIAFDIVTSASDAIAISKLHLLRAAISLDPSSERRRTLLNVAREAILQAISDPVWGQQPGLPPPALTAESLTRHLSFASTVAVRGVELPSELKGTNAMLSNRPIAHWEERNATAVKSVLDELSQAGSLFLDTLSPGGPPRRVAMKIELNMGIEGPPSVTDPVVTGATLYELLERGHARGVALHFTVGDSCGVENAPIGRTSMDILRETGNYHHALKAALRFVLRRDEDGERRARASQWLNHLAGLESSSPPRFLRTAEPELEALALPWVQCVDYDETGFVPVRTSLSALGLAFWGNRDFHLARPWVEADHRVHVTRGCSTHLFAGWTGAVKGLIGLHALGLRPADVGLNELGTSALDMLVMMMHLSGFNGIIGTKSRVGDLNEVAPDDALTHSTELWKRLSLLKGWGYWVEQTFAIERELREALQGGTPQTRVMAEMRRRTRSILDEADRRSPGFRTALWEAVADGTRSGLLAMWRIRTRIPVSMRDERMGMRIGVLCQLPWQAELVVQGLPKIGTGGGPDAYETVRDAGVVVAGTDEVAVDLAVLRAAGVEGNPWEYNCPLYGALQFGRGPALWDEIRVAGAAQSAR